MTKTFNLDSFRTYAGAKTFSGRPRGEEVRKQLGLTKLDASQGEAVVIIPQDVYTVNMSFFLGMFAESVQKYGAEEFQRHYVSTPPRL